MSCKSPSFSFQIIPRVLWIKALVPKFADIVILGSVPDLDSIEYRAVIKIRRDISKQYTL